MKAKRRACSAHLVEPGILSNTPYTVLIENCRLKHGVDWDTARILPRRNSETRGRQKKNQPLLVVVAAVHFDFVAARD